MALAPQEGELQQYGEGEYEDYGQYEGDDGGYEGAMVGMDGTKGESGLQYFLGGFRRCQQLVETLDNSKS